MLIIQFLISIYMIHRGVLNNNYDILVLAIHCYIGNYSISRKKQTKERVKLAKWELSFLHKKDT